jgi:hypothetical protein
VHAVADKRNIPAAWSRPALVATTVVHLLLALRALAFFLYVWGTWTRPTDTDPMAMGFDGPVPWFEHSLTAQVLAAVNGLLVIVLVVATARLWAHPSRRVIAWLLAAVAVIGALEAYGSAMLWIHEDFVRLWSPLVLAAWLAWLVLRWRRAATA